MNAGETAREQAIGELYAVAPEEFVRARDALVKMLRGAGDKEGAAFVKALRRPSRVAWALNHATARSPDALAALEDAVSGAVASQAAGGDVRAAIAALHEAVRSLAAAAAAATTDSAARIDPGTLGSAILAVLGTPDSFALLRAGRLAEVPEGGGLDLLAALSTAAPVARPVAQKPAVTPAKDDAADRARAALDAAEAAVAAARARAAKADAALQDAEFALKDALQQLREAERRTADATARRDAAAAEAAAAGRASAEAERIRAAAAVEPDVTIRP